MTLVIAQRLNGRVSFSSDSRISFGAGHGCIDYGIKIFSVPVRIFSSTDATSRHNECLYDYQMGLAMIGSTVNAYTVKDSVYEVLQHLQCVPGYTDISMDGIAGIVFRIYRKATVDLGGILRGNGICQLLLAGFCPANMNIRLFVFDCDFSRYPLDCSYKEVLSRDGRGFFGSGKTEAREVHDEHPHYNVLEIVRRVVRERKVDTVGGGIQYGEVDDHLNFKIFGVQDYELNDDGTPEYVNTIRGINWYKGEFERESNQLHISYTFVTPFENQINQIWREKGIY